MPKISIIVPVYKSEAFLHQCIDSILCQTYSDFELILINDGSPDRSGEICDQYASKDVRIRVYHQLNSGVSSARNNGLRLAMGKYITFIDSDDTVHPQYLEHMVQNQNRSGADVVITGYIRCIGTQESHIGSLDGTVSTKNNINQDNLMAKALQQGLLNTCWGKLYLAEVIRKCSFPSDICWGEDTVFVLNCLLSASKICFVSEQEYRYRHSMDGLDRRFDISKPRYMLRYYQSLFSFTKQMLPDSTEWKKAVDIKVSQEIMRTILALSGQNVSLVQKQQYLRILFSDYTVNQCFCNGIHSDNNPSFLKFLSHFQFPIVWLAFLSIAERNNKSLRTRKEM